MFGLETNYFGCACVRKKSVTYENNDSCKQRLIIVLTLHIECNFSLKGELQRQNKLISSERPFKILQNETKINKIGQADLEIFNFKN